MVAERERAPEPPLHHPLDELQAQAGLSTVRTLTVVSDGQDQILLAAKLDLDRRSSVLSGVRDQLVGHHPQMLRARRLQRLLDGSDARTGGDSGGDQLKQSRGGNVHAPALGQQAMDGRDRADAGRSLVKWPPGSTLGAAEQQ